MLVDIDKVILASPERKDLVDKIVDAGEKYSKTINIDVKYSGLPYIRTIDSLNTINGVLTENLSATMQDLDNMTESRNDFQNQTEELSDKVNKGSKLTAFGFTSEGIKEKGSGSYKETERASRCTHVRSCFSLGENSIASSGNKTVYMRVITPGGSVLNSSNANALTTEGGQS